MNDSPSWTPRQYLELEAICDRFEAALQAADAAPIPDYLKTASPQIRDQLEAELNAILRQFKPETVCDSGDACDANLTFRINEALLGRIPFNTANVQLAASDRLANTPTTRVNQQGAAFPTLHQQETIGFSHNVARRQRQTFAAQGRFQLEEILGHGGAAIVWKAVDVELQRRVAIKLPHPSTVSDASRFVREVKATAALKHPNIVTLLEAGVLDGQCYMVNELVDGQPLAELVRDQPVPPEHAITITRAIADAIRHSHHQGIIHRDLKPHNVLVDADGRPMVTDFGLAKLLDRDQTLTCDGDLIGTPAYMAPEQARGTGFNSDERTDVYGIGCILFQLLTGNAPYRGSFQRVLFQVIHAPSPRIDDWNVEVPEPLAAICEKCLEKSPELRFQTAQELITELDRLQQGQPIQTRPISTLGRYRRWLHREPRLAITTTLVGCLLLAITIGSSWAAWELSQSQKKSLAAANLAATARSETEAARRLEIAARQQAEQASERAQQQAMLANERAREARQTSVFLASFLEPADLMGINRTIDSPVNPATITPELLERAASNADLLLANQPGTLSRIKGVLGNVHRGRGDLDRAEALLVESAELLDGLPADTTLQADRAMLELYQGVLAHSRGLDDSAKQHLQRSIDLHRQSLKSNGITVMGQLQLAQAEFGMAALLMKAKQNQLAIPYLESAVDTRRKLLSIHDPLRIMTELAWAQCQDAEGEDQAYLPIALQSLTDQDQSGEVVQAVWLYTNVLRYRSQQKLKLAAEKYEQLLEIIERRFSRNSVPWILATGELAGLYREAGDYRKAQPLIALAIDKAFRIAPTSPQLLAARREYGEALFRAQRYAESRQQFELAVKGYGAQSPKLEPCLNGLAWCAIRQQRYADALPYTCQLLQGTGYVRSQSAWYNFSHALVLDHLGRTEEAQPFHRRAIELATEIAPANSPTWISRAGIILEHHHRLEMAETRYRQALSAARARWVEGHPRIAEQMTRLGRLLIRRGDELTGLELLNQARQIFEQSLPSEDQRLVELATFSRK